MQTEVQIGRLFVDRRLELVLDDKLDVATAAMAKYWISEMQCRVIDECLQLYGGYGYMWEYPIAWAYADSRVQRIYAGTNEIMKELISRANLRTGGPPVVQGPARMVRAHVRCPLSATTATKLRLAGQSGPPAAHFRSCAES